MPISAYVGLPGSGKSYNVVDRVVLPALKSGRPVYTNLALKEFVDREFHGLVRRFDSYELLEEPDQTVEWEGGSVVVIDEAWRVFPAGQRSDKIPEPLRKLFAEHRHRVGVNGHAMEIVVLVPDLSMIGRWIRVLVQLSFFHTQMNAVGADNHFQVDVFNGAPEGSHRPEGARIDRQYGKYQEKVYRYYHSHSMSATGEAGDERRMDKRGSVWSSWRFRGYMIGLVVSVILGVVAWNHVANQYRGLVEPVRAVGEASPEPPRRQPQFASPPPDPAPQNTRSDLNGRNSAGGWRVAGWYEHAASGRRVIVTRGMESRDVAANACEWVADRVTRCEVSGLGSVFAQAGQ